MKPDLSSLAKNWQSTIISRSNIEKITGGAISAGYIANLDSKGEGPPGRFKCGRKICYPVDQLVKWLEARSQTVEKGGGHHDN
jgi:hypothetical protein